MVDQVKMEILRKVYQYMIVSVGSVKKRHWLVMINGIVADARLIRML